MAAAPSTPQPSVLEDLVDILYKPAAVFERRREYVAFGLAMVILAVVSGLVILGTKSALEPVLDAMAKQQVAEILKQNPQLTEEQLQGTRGMIRMGTMGTMLVYPVIAPLLIGLLLWVVGKFLESRAGLAAAIMVATYSYVPRLIGTIVVAGLALLLPEGQDTNFFSLSLSPARFLDPATTSVGVLGALARLDLFILWQTVLAGIGISVLGGISRGRGMVAAFVVWALGFLPLVPALLRG